MNSARISNNHITKTNTLESKQYKITILQEKKDKLYYFFCNQIKSNQYIKQSYYKKKIINYIIFFVIKYTKHKVKLYYNHITNLKHGWTLIFWNSTSWKCGLHIVITTKNHWIYTENYLMTCMWYLVNFLAGINQFLQCISDLNDSF